MFRKRKSKKIDEALTPTLTGLVPSDLPTRERTEHADAHGSSPNGHVVGQPDEGLDDREFTVEPHSVSDDETEARDGERALNAEANDGARPVTGDDAVDRVDAICRQRIEDDPARALNDVRARVKELGYLLACAGRTFMEPDTKRTYYIMDPDERLPLNVFHSGDVDLTLLELCVWSEVAFRRWKSFDPGA